MVMRVVRRVLTRTPANVTLPTDLITLTALSMEPVMASAAFRAAAHQIISLAHILGTT